MPTLRYFFLSMNVLNGLLAAAVAAVLFFAVIPFLNPAVIALPSATKTVAEPGEMAAPLQSSSPADYTMISEQNLFHPERKIPPEKQPEKVIPKPEVFLYGTLITNDASYAFIEDKKAPYSTPGRSKRQITLKKGDSLSGYTLSEIEANRIVFVKGEDKLVVALDDRAKRRTGEGSALMATAPQAPPSSAPADTPNRPGMGGPASRPLSQPFLPSNPQTTPSPSSGQDASSPKPGIGDSGIWPPTKSSIEQTRQKILEGQQMRLKQMKGNQ